jgi:hypothetical protein
MGVPLAALAAGRLVFPAWVAGDLRSRRTILVLMGAAAGAMVWTTAGLAYRVLEVPEPPAVDVPAYLASLPTEEQNAAKPRLLQALSRFSGRQRGLPEAPPPSTAPAGDRRGNGTVFPFFTQVLIAVREGWPQSSAPLDEWMGRLFDAPWVAELRTAAELPRGVLRLPSELRDEQSLVRLFAAANAGTVLAGHGLWQQAHGHPEAFVEDLHTGLALSRHVQHHADRMVFDIGRSITLSFRLALDRWLMRLSGRPDLLRQVVAELERHEAETVRNGDDTFVASYLIARENLEHPEQALRQAARGGQGRDLRVELTARAWEVPWERARNLRLLGWLHGHEHQAPAFARRTLVDRLVPPWPANYEESRRLDKALLRLQQVSVALRGYQATKSNPVRGLDVLVPDFLPAIPTDPYDGRPVRFRVSSGEVLEENDHDRRTVLPGQIVLWCVGEDRQDNGGVLSGDQVPGRPVDVVHLVPLPPRP